MLPLYILCCIKYKSVTAWLRIWISALNSKLNNCNPYIPNPKKSEKIIHILGIWKSAWNLVVCIFVIFHCLYNADFRLGKCGEKIVWWIVPAVLRWRRLKRLGEPLCHVPKTGFWWIWYAVYHIIYK